MRGISTSVSVCGPLRVHVGGQRAEITAPAQRTLLGLLATRARGRWRRRTGVSDIVYAQLAVESGHHVEAKRWLTEIADQEPLHAPLLDQHVVARRSDRSDLRQPLFILRVCTAWV